jgi:hypothetical protein
MIDEAVDEEKCLLSEPDEGSDDLSWCWSQ